MAFAKLVIQNLRKSYYDSAIFIVSIIIITALLFSANMMGNFEFFSSTSKSYISNSLPIIISLTAICLTIYINTFNLRQRCKELASYMLSGLSKPNVILLFTIENFIIGFFSMLLGMIFGYILFNVILLIISYNGIVKLTFEPVLAAIKLTVIYYLVIQLVVTLFMSATIYKLNLKKLMYHKKNIENTSTKQSCKQYTILFIVLFGVFSLQINNLDNFMNVGTIALVLWLLIYFSYSILLGYLQLGRLRLVEWFYKKNHLLLSSQILSKSKTTAVFSTVLSLCLIFSSGAYVAGYIFINSKQVIISKDSDSIMGFIQSYIAILFVVVIFSIIALQQIAEMREYERNYLVIKNLGKNKTQINRFILQQIIAGFIFPLFVSFLIILFITVPLDKQLLQIFNQKKLFTQAILQYGGMFLFLSICFIIITYIGVKSYISKLFIQL